MTQAVRFLAELCPQFLFDLQLCYSSPFKIGHLQQSIKFDP